MLAAAPTEYLAVNTSRLSIEVAAMEIPATMQALKSVDIWIGDTGASNHCTFSMEGMYNISHKSVATMSAT